MKRALPLLLILAACGTPQERCISGVSRDLRVVDRLITEVQGNLTRGYALEEVTVYKPVWTYCRDRYYSHDGKYTSGGPQFCWEDIEYTVEKPRAIDLNAERSKLEGLQDKRRVLALQAAPGVAQCKALHPE